MIRTLQAHLPVFAVTHAGMSGKNNEDRYAVSAYLLSEEDPTPAVFAVLADGIGGHRAGEVASEMAVEVISQQVAASDGRSPLETLTAAIHLASQQIYAAAQADDARSGMGSTCSCAWVINDRLYTATVGDSRIYLLRNGSINQLSTDHTWIQEALERGILTPEQARNHPNQHVIRRYLGSPTAPLVDNRMRLAALGEASEAHQGLQLLPGDRLMLCSDGLSDLVSDAEMLETLNAMEPNAALQALVDLANARGGHDNITMVLLHAPLKVLPGRKTRRSSPVLLAAAIVLLLGLIAAGIWGVSALVDAITRVDTPTPTPGLVTVTSASAPQTTPSVFVTSTLVPRDATATGLPAFTATLRPPTATSTPQGLTPVLLPTLQGPTLTPWPTSIP